MTPDQLLAVAIVTAAIYLAVQPLWEDWVTWWERRGRG